MKKIAVILLTALLLSFTACGGGSPSHSQKDFFDGQNSSETSKDSSDKEEEKESGEDIPDVELPDIDL